MSEVSEIAILLIGVALLATTFIEACLFLKEDFNILPIANFVASGGFTPLVEASIQMMYLA